MTVDMWFKYCLSVFILLNVSVIIAQDTDSIAFFEPRILYENDPCINAIDISVGQCVNIYNCDLITEKKNVDQLQICSFTINTPIICCPLENILILTDGKEQNKDYLPPPTPSTQSKRRPTSSSPTTLPKIVKSGEINQINRSVKKCVDYETAGISDSFSISVVGGDLTIPGEFPHMAAIGFGKNSLFSWYCAGSIISENFILTAAHCKTLNKELPTTVRVGDKDIVANEEGIDYAIETFIVHPDYSRLSKYNDIGLIKINTTIEFFFNIRPACLWQTSNINYTEAIATGWGHTEFGGAGSANLLKVSLDVFENKLCTKYYTAGADLSSGLANAQVCAGKLTGGKDTCQGDSGGPLGIEILGTRVMHHLIGITSFGIDCGSKVPSVYTRVSSFVPWIESIVWPEN